MKILALLFVAALPASAGCGSSASIASAPTAATTTTTAVTTTTTIPASSSSDLTGIWTGTGNDAQGAETFAWTVTQSGDRLSGSVVLDSANRADESCGSCHKQKSGTLAGTFSNGALTLTLDFPAGGSDITPLCGITMNATTRDVAAGRIAATYTGTTTCEGPITDGTLVVAR